jgi:ABC-type multidrug transport system ATPase subunit
MACQLWQAGSVLTIEDMRVDVGGVPDTDGLTLRSEARHLVILGGGRGLFEALGGTSSLQRGRVAIEGSDPRALVREGALASAPIDVPLPPKWSALEYATWSARLGGAEEAPARSVAEHLLGELGIDPRTLLGKATVESRRAAAMAGAIATGARVIVFRDPAEGIPKDVARAFARVLARALEDRAWIMFAAELPLASPFALAAEEAIVVFGSRVVAQGAPAEIAALERSYAVRATGDVAAFAKLVEDAGGRVSPRPSEHMAIDLGAELEVRDLFALAQDANAVVVEVLPLGRPFS